MEKLIWFGRTKFNSSPIVKVLPDDFAKEKPGMMERKDPVTLIKSGAQHLSALIYFPEHSLVLSTFQNSVPLFETFIGQTFSVSDGPACTIEKKSAASHSQFSETKIYDPSEVTLVINRFI
jgi:hypothetical protein